MYGNCEQSIYNNPINLFKQMEVCINNEVGTEKEEQHPCFIVVYLLLL